MPLLKFTASTDDKAAYVNRCQEFLKKNIEDYTTVRGCLTAFNDIFYTKDDANVVNSFWVEVVLRGFLISGENDYRIPKLTDFDHVQFANLSRLISNESICGKLSFERIREYLANPATMLYPREAGIQAPFFGITN